MHQVGFLSPQIIKGEISLPAKYHLQYDLRWAKRISETFLKFNVINLCNTIQPNINHAAKVETREPIRSKMKSSIFFSFIPIAESINLEDILSGVNSPSSWSIAVSFLSVSILSWRSAPRQLSTLVCAFC